jgi:DNA gyrase subunit B/topoisomerase-4 subunit B
MEVVFRDQTARRRARSASSTTAASTSTCARSSPSGARPRSPTGAARSTRRRDEHPGSELALAWTEATDEHVRSYVNGIPTRDGGTHEAGLRAGVVKAVRNYIDDARADPKGVTLTAEDIREGMVAVLSTYVIEPAVPGQTKGRLNNPEWRRRWTSGAARRWRSGSTTTKSVAEAVGRAHHPRRAAREASPARRRQVTRRRAVSHRLNLPGSSPTALRPTRRERAVHRRG